MQIVTADFFFLLQLIAIVCIGGFIGEFYRVAITNSVINKLFFARVLAGSFLSCLLGYLIYYFNKNKVFALIAAGLMAYQEENFVSQLAQQMVKNLLGLNQKEDEE